MYMWREFRIIEIYAYMCWISSSTIWIRSDSIALREISKTSCLSARLWENDHLDDRYNIDQVTTRFLFLLSRYLIRKLIIFHWVEFFVHRKLYDIIGRVIVIDIA